MRCAAGSLGRNLGPTGEVLDGLPARLAELASLTGGPVSVIGWSLGGIYARELARQHPGQVRRVITLGSPFALTDASAESRRPRVPAAQQAARHAAGCRRASRSSRPIGVPSTAVYSRRDGIVSWHACIEPETELHQNVEVRCAHLGFGVDPATLWLIADRLAVPAGQLHRVPRRLPRCASLYPARDAGRGVASMQQLTGLDAAFLALETANSTGHVGGVCILDPQDAPAPLTLARLTEVLGDRLPLVPVLRRKLLNVPLGLDQPYWVDDPNFDIEYHIREIALPRPGSEAQLTEQVARLHARPLDRSRPLWEIYLITGLARRRAAVYTKIHHSAIDGASGAELLTILLDLTPDGRELPPRTPFVPARPPGPAALAALAAAKLAWRPVQTVRFTNELVRVLPTLAPALSTLVGGMLGLNRGDGEVIPTTPGRAPATPFNRPITPHRRLALRSVDLDSVKAVKNAFGVSVNDVVMAMCAGALRRWLADHDALPDAPLIAMIPVSVRDPASKAAMGNKVSAMLADPADERRRSRPSGSRSCTPRPRSPRRSRQ